MVNEESMQPKDPEPKPPVSSSANVEAGTPPPFPVADPEVLDRNTSPMCRMALQVIGVSLAGMAIMAITYVMIDRPLESTIFDGLVLLLVMLAAFAMTTYIKPSGWPAAISTAASSLITVAFFLFLGQSKYGHELPGWLDLLIAILVLGCSIPWVLRRSREAFDGTLLGLDE